jgi:hypothetical protein
MNARANWLLLAIVAASCALGINARDARADVSPKVIKALKGMLIISSDPVSPADTDKATIAAYKAARLKEVKGDQNSEGSTAWKFHYTAFLKKKVGTTLEIDFYDGDKFVANQRLEGVDATAPVLEGDVDISEDDGPAKGKTYTLKVVGQVKGKDVVVASASLTMN